MTKVTDSRKRSHQAMQAAHDALLVLGSLTVRFAEVERATRFPDGARETDVEHSFHLALSATELAGTYYPELDVGLVAQFSIVHDLAEVYVGDTWTFNVSEAKLAQKKAAEAQAVEKLLHELPPHTAQLLKRYEEQSEPEARFVRFVDKFLPAIINIMTGPVITFREDYGMHTIAHLRAAQAEREAAFLVKHPDFPFLHGVRKMIMHSSERHVFPEAFTDEQANGLA